MYSIGMPHILFTPCTPSILMYKSQIVSSVSILFRFIYMSILYISMTMYLFWTISIIEYGFV